MNVFFVFCNLWQSPCHVWSLPAFRCWLGPHPYPSCVLFLCRTFFGSISFFEELFFYFMKFRERFGELWIPDNDCEGITLTRGFKWWLSLETLDEVSIFKYFWQSAAFTMYTVELQIPFFPFWFTFASWCPLCHTFNVWSYEY